MSIEKFAGYKPHDACSLFPIMNDFDLLDLAEDIHDHGLLEPVVLHEGRVLDGRNRLLACERAGVEPRLVEWSGGESPTAWVISKNVRRRHLTFSQRAMLAVQAKTMFEREAHQRQLRGVPANLQEGGEAAEHAARSLNVSPRSVYSAARVEADGAPELAQSVKDGRTTVSAAAEIATLPVDEQREIVARGDKEIIAAARDIRRRRAEERIAKRAAVAADIASEPPPLPDGPFRVIVVDPPWRYETTAESDDGLRGLVDYPDMSLEAIHALPIAKLAHEDCVLWLWTTNAFMREAYACLDAWGFEAKTILTWDKEQLGVGRWLRNVTEHAILAVRGNPIVTLTDQSTLIREQRREHSRKPEAFYRLVEGLCPGSKLEMFARQPRDGWQAWGGEATKFVA